MWSLPSACAWMAALALASLRGRQGGPGTYDTVSSQLLLGTPVLLVKETGGCAECLADFLAILDEQAAIIKAETKEEVNWRVLVNKHAPDFRRRLPNQKDDFFKQFKEVTLHIATPLAPTLCLGRASLSSHCGPSPLSCPAHRMLAVSAKSSNDARRDSQY